MTKQRLLVLETIRKNCIHPTATEVYDLVRKVEKISLATVYNSLNYLCDNGYIRRVVIAGEPDRYDGNMTSHFHGVCERCGKIYDFDMPDMKEHISKAYNVNITQFGLSLHIICKDCENKSKK